jgi:hypothetical protein
MENPTCKWWGMNQVRRKSLDLVSMKTSLDLFQQPIYAQERVRVVVQVAILPIVTLPL